MKATHYHHNGGPVPNYYMNQSGVWMYFSKVRNAWVESLVPTSRLERVLNMVTT